MRSRRVAAFLLVVCLLVPLAAAPVANASARLAKLSAGISTHYPKQYSNVTVKARALDASGRPIKGAKLTFTWYYKTSRPSETKLTNSTGYASCTRNISRASTTYKVVVKATGSSGGVTKSASTWFVPKPK
jgi:hypothetical protein